jgi:superfamily II DNA or RNA helicase
MHVEDFELDDAPAFKLRGRQQEWSDAVEADEAAGHRRLLFIAPGGIGKSSVMGHLAQKKWRERGIKTLITENREHLVEQTAGRIRAETGLDVDIEMSDQSASPHTPVVVASTQTTGRINRLTAFAPDHFGFVVADECHLSLSPQSQRILNYFHVGAESLADGWKRPAQFTPLSTVCGFTASPNIGQGRSLGEWYNRVSVNYSYLDSIEEGWLVGLVEKNIPVTIDCRKFRTRRTSEGSDFNVADQSAAIIPIIKELAEQIVRYAHDKKTICFLPSVECARLMAETLQGMGMRAIFASGECLDKSAKTQAYNLAPKGTVFCNCALVTYGIDFPDTDCIAPFAAMISKCRYIQSVYRGTRVLPGVLKEGMTQEQRRAAIALSAKPHCTVLSPFFISDSIDICEPFDLYSNLHGAKRKKGSERDLTKPEVIRDWIKSLEKAADPHRNRQARTIDPVFYSLSVGQDRIASLAVPGDSPASRADLDALLAFGIDTTQVTTTGQAQRLISTLRERDRLHLASPKAIHQLTLRLGWPEDLASKMKGKQAGMLIAKGIRYKRPSEVPQDDPALAYGEG